MVLLESECTPQRLLETITALLADSARYSAMSKALYTMAVPDSAERLCAVMEQLVRAKEK